MPKAIGKSWPNRYTYRGFDNIQQDGMVEAYEDVKVPAGTFKAFKIVAGNEALRVTTWYVPELGLFIKTRTERLSTFPSGAGVRETEVVSYDFKP